MSRGPHTSVLKGTLGSALHLGRVSSGCWCRLLLGPRPACAAEALSPVLWEQLAAGNLPCFLCPAPVPVPCSPARAGPHRLDHMDACLLGLRGSLLSEPA